MIAFSLASSDHIHTIALLETDDTDSAIQRLYDRLINEKSGVLEATLDSSNEILRVRVDFVVSIGTLEVSLIPENQVISGTELESAIVERFLIKKSSFAKEYIRHRHIIHERIAH